MKQDSPTDGNASLITGSRRKRGEVQFVALREGEGKSRGRARVVFGVLLIGT
jgi:hypothetical protein